VRTQAAWAKLDRAQETLQKCELFRDLQMRQIVEVATLAEEVMLKPNQMLLEEAQPARYIFIILEGRAVAQLETPQGFLSLGLVGPADAAGWSSLVGDQVYPASVKALTPLRAARIDTSRLARLMDIDPSMGYTIGKRLSSLFCRQYKSALEAFKTSF
jgi:CRP-like cAMP-binding protein